MTSQPNDKQLISIIIVNWNGKKWLQKCLDSLLVQTYKNFEIIFVDNASTDGSVEYVKIHYSSIKIVEAGINLGFAAGNNFGISHALGELILLLNNDTWVKEGFLDSLVNFYENSKYDVVAPFESTYSTVSGKKEICTIDTLGHPVRLSFPEHSIPFYLSGVCVLFSRQMYFDTLGLDDGFFMYFEEIDWFWRLQLMGYEMGIADDLYVYHAGAGSTGSGIKYSSFLWRNQNCLQMLIKNYSWFNLLWVLPLYLLQNLFEALSFLIILKPEISRSYILGWWFNIINLKRVLRERGQVQKLRKNSDWYVIKKMYHYPYPGKLIHLKRFLTKK